MYRTHLPSTAAPVGSHDANRPPATNGKAPVTPRQGAAVEGARADHETGAAASGAGIAGMAGPAGPARPEQHDTNHAVAYLLRLITPNGMLAPLLTKGR